MFRTALDTYPTLEHIGVRVSLDLGSIFRTSRSDMLAADRVGYRDTLLSNNRAIERVEWGKQKKKKKIMGRKGKERREKGKSNR